MINWNVIAAISSCCVETTTLNLNQTVVKTFRVPAERSYNLAGSLTSCAQVFLHVSTTYCNVDRQVIDEQLYPPHADWRETIRIAELADEQALRVLTPKYIGSGPRALPNTYTFAKSLAEHVVSDHAHLVPSVIFRPSIGMRDAGTDWGTCE